VTVPSKESKNKGKEGDNEKVKITN